MEAVEVKSLAGYFFILQLGPGGLAAVLSTAHRHVHSFMRASPGPGHIPIPRPRKKNVFKNLAKMHTN